MRKINDRIVLGFVSGLIGNIPKAIFNEVLYRNQVEKRRFGDIISGIFMPKKQATSKKGTLFGVIGDFTVSSVLGIPLVYLLTFSGKDKYLFKGWLSGLIGLGLFRGIVANVGPGKTYPKDPVTNATMSLSSSLWGLTTAFAMVLLGNSSLFQPKVAALLKPTSKNGGEYQSELPIKLKYRRIQRIAK